jgi:DNA-binding CsgD family transcriptional regulator
MRRFFRNDDESQFTFGGETARWTLGEGPLRSFMDRRDIGQLVAALPSLWTTFFSDTTSHTWATLDGDTVRYKAFDLPGRNSYFESYIIGFTKEILEMFCANPIIATRIRGGDGKGYHYLLHLGPTATAQDGGGPVASDRKERARRSIPSLSDREAEVLMLLAEGKTNAEIGVALGISGKTAQHHITHAYKKIGVSGRVGATMWLAERGLIGK